MGVFTYTDEDYSVIPTARIFKAFLDSHNLMPKLLPHEIKSIEFIKGDGGVGSIKQINFPEAKLAYNQMSNGNFQISVISYEKHEIDEVDEKTFTYKYSLIEGMGISDKIEKVSYDIKLEHIQGGTFSKMTTTIYTHGDFELKEKELKAFKEKALGLYKVVENYLLRNPDTYR